MEDLIPRYVEALCAEMRHYPAGLPVHTINFGGGTPSLLSAEQLEAIIGACHQWFDVEPRAEVTIEANPGNLLPGYFAGIRSAGVNRLSFGVQSFHAPELAMLARRHSAAEAVLAVERARGAGFDNISLDFMYGLPGQTLDGWRATLDRAAAIHPEHLSLYGLSIYDHLPLGRQVRAGALPRQDEDLMADMYELAEETLAGSGYEQYEISNWAVDAGHRCSHNLAYWLNTGYIGLGAGAHSYFDGRRYVNEKKPAAYCRLPQPIESEVIGPELARAETAILGLRLNDGAELTPEEMAKLRDCAQAGLLDIDGAHARLTPKGRLLSNEVFWRLLPG